MRQFFIFLSYDGDSLFFVHLIEFWSSNFSNVHSSDEGQMIEALKETKN